MASKTFENLHPEKKQAVIQALIYEFESCPFPEAKIKHIVDALGIPRGSFYQYFKNLTESYFYILDRELTETHALFAAILREQDGNLDAALEIYGERLCKDIFEGERYALYRNRYLYWSPSLDQEWRAYLLREGKVSTQMEQMPEEMMHYLKAIVHSLMQRLFMEQWDPETFLVRYRQYVRWIIGGIQSGTRNGADV